MITAVRKLRFCAGHRVLGHEGQCAHLHGHDYTVELHARTKASAHGGRNQDDIGRVIDFSVLKAKVGTWIDENWDHRTILNESDPFLAIFQVGVEETVDVDEAGEQLTNSIWESNFNPTAENIASFLLDVMCPRLLPPEVVVFKVVVHETPNCFASAELSL